MIHDQALRLSVMANPFIVEQLKAQADPSPAGLDHVQIQDPAVVFWTLPDI
jgi:hypothetical protein